MRDLDLKDCEAYLERLRNDPQEAEALADRMRITVTRFFREGERWEILAKTALPSLLASRDPQSPLRAWSAGCAGGEEPYTLSILWLSQILPRFPGRTLRILATDIDKPSLERAASALYQSGELREVPPGIRDRFFRRRNGLWSPVPEALDPVTLRRHNLLTEPSPGKFDLVCCRYLPFTYFRRERRLEAARRLLESLAPDGVLMIGAKEELGPAAPLFTPWPEAPGLFRPADPGNRPRADAACL